MGARGRHHPVPIPTDTAVEGDPMTTDSDPRRRRFSEGVEHFPALPASARVGSFADGLATSRPGRTGSFADGLARSVPTRTGSFADTFGPRVAAGTVRPRFGVARGRPRPQQA
jgi:hypothetical protein